MRDTPRLLGPLTCAVLLAALLAGCGTLRPCTDARDPFEPVNRPVHVLNDVVVSVVLDPAADVYRALLPQLARDGVRTALGNLRRPLSAVHHTIRGDLGEAGRSVRAFAIDMTVGVGGLRRSAACMGLADRPAGFAGTLAAWGAAPGPYVVLPFLGPTTARGAAGRVADVVTDPVRRAVPGGARIGYTATRVVSRQERTLDRRRSAPPEDATYEAVRRRVLERATRSREP